MTPDEVSTLKYAGQVLVENFSSMVPLTFFYGAYVLLASLAMYNLLAKPTKTTSTWVLCSMLSLIFLVTTAYFCLFVAFCFKLISGALIDNTELALSDRLEIASASTLQITLAELWVSGSGNSLPFIFTDGIVVWRAWAVWGGRRNVIILPVLTLLATLGLSMASAIIVTITSTSTPDFVQGQVENLGIAGSTMSLATNLMAVILIGVKAYQHHKFMKDTIGQGYSPSGKVLIFLTESGSVYLAFQIITLCLTTTDSTPLTTLDAVDAIWINIMNIFSAAYPSLVILIANSRYSIANTTRGSGDKHPGTHISFAQPVPQGTLASTEICVEERIQSSAERHTEKGSESQDPKYVV
ncbi:hypothetical protein C8J56DRAFT_1082966, partial [Mycena floridula]